MILARTSFRLKFGKAKPSLALWKEIMEKTKGHEHSRPIRLLSDLSGPSYTIVLDMQLRGFTDLGVTTHMWHTEPSIRELYPQFVELCDTADSDLFHLEHEVGDTELPVGSIVEQMTFRLKYGTAKEACSIWRKILDDAKGKGLRLRFFTDITGPSYTLMMEQHHRNMLEYGPHQHAWLTNESLREHYTRFVPLCESSVRTLYQLQHRT